NVCAAINAHPVLQGTNGVAAEDFTIDAMGAAMFTLRARNPGYSAAAIIAAPKRSGVNILPSSPRALAQNWNDLQARSHLYVSAGTPGLALEFPIDTTQLADGCHELTAVGY